MSFIENCRQLIALESTPSTGNMAAAEFVGEIGRQAGFHVDYQHENLSGLGQSNVILRPPSIGLPQEELLLLTHLDTVDPGPYAAWKRTGANPFEATIYQDSIFGLGAADTKLDILCKIEAARKFLDKDLKLPFVLVGTYGAQQGMAGVIRLLRRKMINAQKALVGEPTGLHLIHAGQGLATVEISIPFSDEEKEYRMQHDLAESTSTQSRFFVGKAAHSSLPQMGENAIVKMLDYLEQLPDGIAVMDLDGGVNHNSVPSQAVLEIDMVGGFKNPIVPKITQVKKALKRVEALFSSSGTDVERPLATMNIGMIRTFADGVRMTGSCRLGPKVSTVTYERWMEEIRRASEAEGAVFRVKDYKPPFQTTQESSFVAGCQEVLRAMGGSNQLNELPVTTEASVLTRMGVECLVFGPGQSVGNSHAPDESITIDELNQATAFYAKVIERFCL